MSSHSLSWPKPQARRGWRDRGELSSRRSVLPGFGLSLGFTLAYLSLIVLIPLAALVLRSASLGLGGFWAIAADPRTVAAVWLSLYAAFIAACVNLVLGTITAWVLVRYRFPGRQVIDALVDLPFAFPTAVAGIALTALYAPTGWIGQLLTPLGVRIAYTPLGVIVALIFVGLPFAVRTVQPVMEELDREMEEASATLGASRAKTMARVVLPVLLPAMLTGFALSFARAVGEYGSVVFIAGNIPYVSEIAPLLIIIRLEEYSYAAAAGIGTVMLLISLVMLLAINLLQAYSRRRLGYA